MWHLIHETDDDLKMAGTVLPPVEGLLLRTKPEPFDAAPRAEETEALRPPAANIGGGGSVPEGRTRTVPPP